jgi:hypothetical protein
MPLYAYLHVGQAKCTSPASIWTPWPQSCPGQRMKSPAFMACIAVTLRNL